MQPQPPFLCRLLQADPELAEVVPEVQREAASRACVAGAMALPVGAWEPSPGLFDCGLGLLVIDGILVQRVGIEGRYGAELLGAGDLLRLWHGDSAPLSVTTDGRCSSRRRSRFSTAPSRVAPPAFPRSPSG